MHSSAILNFEISTQCFPSKSEINLISSYNNHKKYQTPVNGD